MTTKIKRFSETVFTFVGYSVGINLPLQLESLESNPNPIEQPVAVHFPTSEHISHLSTLHAGSKTKEHFDIIKKW